MRVVKILGVVFGALFLLTGISLLAGATVFNASSGQFDQQLAEQGLAGPVEGRVIAIEGPIYTVEYTDKQGVNQTGRGAVADGTTPPAQGDDVQVYYSTVDPGQIIILDFPGGNFAGVAGLLRTVGIVCLVIGAILLLAGIIGLLTGRRRAPAVTAGPVAYAPDAVPPGQSGATQTQAQTQPADAAQPQPSQPTAAPTADAAQTNPSPPTTPTDAPGPAADPAPTQPQGPATPSDPIPPPDRNRPGG